MDAYYCVVWEHQYGGHHRRNEAYAVSMKMYLGYQNAQNEDVPMRRVDHSLQVAVHTRIDHDEESCRDPHERHTAHAIRAYSSESLPNKERERGALTRVRVAPVYTICPHPPLHNPNAFPEFTEFTSSPLKKDGIGIDSHNSGVAWPVDIWSI